MRIVVQKFGGTSVHTRELRERAVQKIKQALDEGFSPVVVVSAMGRKGSPYATDTLISLAREEFSQVEPRELDLLMSCGEIISTVVMAQALRREGLRSIALTGGQAGIITDSNFGDARILRVEPERIRKHLEEGYVVVVAGFQGVTEGGDITTLGRGGSDTTAVVLGAALEAEFVDIFTDVEGVMTADPRIVPDAQIIRGLTYTEAAEIVQQGAKVIHHKAMSVAREYRVPLRVRSLTNEGEGTIICDIKYLVERGIRGAGLRPLYSIAYRAGLAQVVIPLGEKPENKLLAFSSLAQKGISIDLINLFPDNTAFVVEEQRASLVKEILEKAGFTVTINAPCAKVSLVGFEMADRPGVMAQLVEAMQESGIEILQTGDSHVTISCLVWEKDMERAIQALHRKFQLDELC
ncbi:MAG: aspartate kinase [Candidatus Atribacteria bacterium]|uniref:aspartate kinase n=1 Tax=Atrimonas thermophila TaxID=3064161 RepID=UPI0024AAA18D|nr:aspartate kinase [Candidatus Atribacteria bacterium]MDI3530428.1 aspartate kinase [Candidatus Atribacteria bacterium]